MYADSLNMEEGGGRIAFKPVLQIDDSVLGLSLSTPLQYSCLENPRDRGAWWAVVYGVAQSQTRLK